MKKLSKLAPLKGLGQEKGWRGLGAPPKLQEGITGDPLELVASQDIEGNLIERVVDFWLRDRMNYSPGRDYQRQYIMTGGRAVPGGSVVDFLITVGRVRPLVLRIQGEWWHGDLEQREKDRTAKTLLVADGNDVVDIQERDLYDDVNYVMEMALKGIELEPDDPFLQTGGLFAGGEEALMATELEKIQAYLNGLDRRLDDVETEMASIRYLKATNIHGDGSLDGKGISGGTIAPSAANFEMHLMTGTWTNDSPSAGYIAWAGIVIYYKGMAYSITDGNSNKKYIYFDYDVSTTTFQASDTKPTLVHDDIQIMNIGGKTARFDSFSQIEVDRLIAGSLDVGVAITTGGYFQAGTGVKDSTLTGINMGPTEIVGQLNGSDQFVISATTGGASFGAGKCTLDTSGMGITADGTTYILFFSGDTAIGNLWSNYAANTTSVTLGAAGKATHELAYVSLEAKDVNAGGHLVTFNISSDEGIYIDASTARLLPSVNLNLGTDLNLYSDDLTTLKASIDGATGNILTVGSYQLNDTNTTISEDASSNLTFKDVNAAPLTALSLTQLLTAFGDHFLGDSLDTRWTSGTSGAGAAVALVDNDTTRPGGWVRLTTGTADNGAAYIYFNGVEQLNTNPGFIYICRAQLSATTSIAALPLYAPNGTEVIQVRIDTDASESTWRLITTDASSTTNTNTSLAPDTSVHTYLVDAAPTVVKLYIDGVLKATNTANITALNLDPYAYMITRVASASKNMDIDWIAIIPK